MNEHNSLKGNLYEKVKVQPLASHKFKLLEDFEYYGKERDFLFPKVVVPAGYKTNGADIPRIFWSIFPPNRSDYLPAVIVHDYLCDKKQYKQADMLFEEILEVLGVSKITRDILVFSVKLYHRLRYGVK